MSNSSLRVDREWSNFDELFNPKVDMKRTSIYLGMNVNLFYNRKKINTKVATLFIHYDKYESINKGRDLLRCQLSPTHQFSSLFTHYSPLKNQYLREASENIILFNDGAGNKSFEYWVEDKVKAIQIADLLIKSACEDYAEVLNKIAEIIKADKISFSDLKNEE